MRYGLIDITINFGKILQIHANAENTIKSKQKQFIELNSLATQFLTKQSSKIRFYDIFCPIV